MWAGGMSIVRILRIFVAYYKHLYSISNIDLHHRLYQVRLNDTSINCNQGFHEANPKGEKVSSAGELRQCDYPDG